MSSALDASYAHCQAVAKARAKNFYYSFLALPAPKRQAMCALYAFMRQCDDLSDEAGATLSALDAWRNDLDKTLAGNAPNHPIWPALADITQRFNIPPRYYHEMIDGVATDLTPRRIESFDDLYRYCYLVASVVGLTTIHVFGFDDPRAPQLAEKCGIAFQLTNIIRDVKEDAGNGRVYLPAEDLAAHNVSPADLKGPLTPQLQKLLQFQSARARAYYTESAPLLPLIHRDSRSALWALIEIYSRLLTRIEARNHDVFEARIRLSTFEKSTIALRAVAGLC